MSQRRRLLLLVVFEVVLMGLTLSVGRWWVGGSWRWAVESCLFFLVMLIVFEAARRRRERRAATPPPSL